MPTPLYVITALSNAGNFKIRYKLHDEWAKRVIDAGAIPVTVECAYPGQTHQAKAMGPGHMIIQVRAQSIMWHKENLLNIGFKHLPADAEFVSWQDCDVEFGRSDWVSVTTEELRYQKVVQMFSVAADLMPDGSVDAPIIAYVAGLTDEHGLTATGFAWAARTDFLKSIDGLCDMFPVSDDADSIIASLFCGAASATLNWLHYHYPPIYQEWLDWKEPIGKYGTRCWYIPGKILHHWHGSRKFRQGNKFEHLRRLKVLQFAPKDLTYNSDGVLEFKDLNSPIAKYMQSYFQSRNEDSVETFGSELQF